MQLYGHWVHRILVLDVVGRFGLNLGENREPRRVAKLNDDWGQVWDKCKIKYNAALSHDMRALSESCRAAHCLAHTIEHLRRLRILWVIIYDPYACKIVDNLFNLLCSRLWSIIIRQRGCLRVRDRGSPEQSRYLYNCSTQRCEVAIHIDSDRR